MGATQAFFLAAISFSSAALLARPPGRIVAVGDVHGDYEAMQHTLRVARLIDDEDRWTGGTTTLVQLGDILDRGVREHECWDLLQKLKAEAPASGGLVVGLLGNHEVLNVMGRAGSFIHSHSHTAFGSDRSVAWSPGGQLARELASCPVAAIIGDSVFVHANLPADATRESLEELNTHTREWLEGTRLAPPAGLLGGVGSPVWDRSLSSPPGVEPLGQDCKMLNPPSAGLVWRTWWLGIRHKPK